MLGMHFGKKRLPDNFEGYVTFTSHMPTMPDEHAYQFTLSFASSGKQITWERVWYLTNLMVEIEGIDTAWNFEEMLESTKKHEIHRFKRDVIHFLRRTHQCLIELDAGLALVAEGGQ